MAARRKPKFGEKTAFVKAHPNTPAAEIVVMAAKKGIKLTPGLVYNLRSSAKKSSGSKKGKPGPKVGARKGRRGGRRAAGGSAEIQLRNAIASLGLVKSREIMGQVEAAFAGR